jgi:uncharacterized protein with HEPN domain
MAQYDDRDHIADIMGLIDLIQSHLADCTRNAFLSDRHKIDATAFRLQAIGESTIKLSDELKARHRTIPWDDIRDMRHIISHHYGKIDPAIVWSVYEFHLEALYMACLFETSAS